MTTVFPFFYSRLVIPPDAPAGSATAGIGFVNSAAAVTVAVSAPLLGALADRRHARKKGLLLSVVAGSICTVLLGYAAPGMTWFSLVTYGVAVVAFSSGNVFYDSMLVDVTSRKRMDYISGLGFAIGYIGGAIPFLALPVLFLCNVENAAAFRAGFTITAAWWFVFSLPLLLSPLPRRDAIAVHSTLNGIRHTLGRILRDRNMCKFLGAYFLYIDGVDTIIVMAVPYGSELGLGARELIAVILGIQIVAFPCSLLYGMLALRFGTKTMIRVGISCYCVAVAAAALLPELNSMGAKYALFMLLALIIAANQGGIQALSRSFFGQIIPPEHAAEYFGFYNIFGKFAAVLGPMLVGISGWLLGEARCGILSLLLLFMAGGYILGKTSSPED